ncbi:4-hydroxybenzoate polyprenyl transferase, variant [Cryptococcus amylolentus CBS 6039]|uniref:4-hydroxybenzoate polyprenyltransferase, mitochondrial n=2 Tax=Cryptococcus amylolentus TaxID=104669 RepID=A0A1E3HX92_9TREE|nr:4-hydroxybenzoate polyprenyl transferase, variant [Cryptococcus amylolentus CBS 6039]ODN80924.1 4-hydroxybenzoate polyprenyl transferase, variant [Cryptococcus amylolentus CBS 6039]ODO09416.1 4-hydroxybenzoate polyprenyl transferase [Cryptococcus amylolentus CBS 6273]
MLPSLARSRACARPFISSISRTPLTSSLRPFPSTTSSLLRSRVLTTSSTSLSSPSTSSPLDSTRPAPVTETSSSKITSELLAPKEALPPTAPTIIDKLVPKWAEKAKPYLYLTRIDKPIGSILLYWPGAWAITMASTVHHLPPSVPIFYLGLFGVGSLIMRGAGCIINDMWDAKMDRQVERTKTRPLASGEVTQLGALTFLASQLSIGLAILTQLNWYSIALGASSLGLVALYPFMKRVTYFPQVVLGFTFNWGALLGWSAVAGVVDWSIAAPMYLGGALWCVGYDMIYAHQDKTDDVLAGVKSMALYFPDTSRQVISGLYATFVSLLAFTGHMAGLGPLYYLISCGGAAAHLAWQVLTVNFDSRPDCWKKFSSNGYLGGLIWLGVAADYVQQAVLGVAA